MKVIFLAIIIIFAVFFLTRVNRNGRTGFIKDLRRSFVSHLSPVTILEIVEPDFNIFYAFIYGHIPISKGDPLAFWPSPEIARDRAKPNRKYYCLNRYTILKLTANITLEEAA